MKKAKYVMTVTRKNGKVRAKVTRVKKAKPRKPKKPRPLKLPYLRDQFASIVLQCGEYVANLDVSYRFWDPEDARALAAWLLNFADWAESREKTP